MINDRFEIFSRVLLSFCNYSIILLWQFYDLAVITSSCIDLSSNLESQDISLTIRNQSIST
jgi:hypothetical protein